MQTTLGPRKLIVAFTFLGYALLLLLWIHVVNPFPDRDSVSQFYFPMLNYLQASLELGNNFFFLKSLTPIEYPGGAMLIPAFVSLLGLQTVILQNPWLINLIPVFVLSLIPVLVKVPRQYLSLFVIALFFYPATQITLKNFNLHSLNVVFFIGGVYLFISHLESKKLGSLTAAITFFWYSCTVKHLGVVLFCIAWLTYLLWKTHRREPIIRALGGGILILLSSLPFYPITGFVRYLQGLIRHNPSLESNFVGISICILLILFLYCSFCLARFQKNRLDLSLKFSNASALIGITLFLSWVVSLDSEFNPILCMTGSMLIGSALVCAFLFKFNFSSIKGLKLLFLLISLSITLTLYFSRLAQVSMIFFPSLYIVLIMTFEECKNWKIPACIAIILFISSNFFPNLQSMEKIFGSSGIGLYTRGFNSLYQNPLNWTKTNVGEYRGNIEKGLSALSFPEQINSLLMLHPHLHSYTALELQFPDHLLYSFPPITLLEQLPKVMIKEMHNNFIEYGLNHFKTMLAQGDIPLILFGTDHWSKYLKLNINLDKVPVEFERNYFCNWLNLSSWKYLIENNKLDKYYTYITLNTGSSKKLFLFVHKKFSEKSNFQTKGYKPGLIAFVDKFREERNPQIKVAELLFQKATFYFDLKQFWSASILLRIASELDQEHLEIKKDLEIVMQNLNSHQRYQHKLYRLGGVAKSLHPDLDNLWGYRKGIDSLSQNLKNYLISKEDFNKTASGSQNQSEGKNVNEQSLKVEAEEIFIKAAEIFHSNPELARELLLKTLEIYPNHEDARMDLKILENNKSERPNENILAGEDKQKSAQLIFNQSSDLFQKDPVRAMILLKRVLVLDPSHLEAKKDLDLLKLKLGLTTESEQ